MRSIEFTFCVCVKLNDERYTPRMDYSTKKHVCY